MAGKIHHACRSKELFMEKPKKTFQFQLILYNLLIIFCIACAVSYYNYRSYKKDILEAEIQSSQNRVASLSLRTQAAYDEMMNILLTCAERKTLFASSTFLGENYTNTASSVYAADALRDLCAISSYNKDIYKLTWYNEGFLLQAGASNGSQCDPSYIMEAPFFSDLIGQTSGRNTLLLADNPFPEGKRTVPKIMPLLRPLSYGGRANSDSSWVFLAVSPDMFRTALQSMPAGSIAYAVTAQGDIAASLNGDGLDPSALIANLLARQELSGSLSTVLDGEDCVVTYEKQLDSGILLFEVLPLSALPFDSDVFASTVLIVFFFCILIGVSLSFLFSIRLGAPIKRLTRRLSLIAQGDFSGDPSIETNDEVGAIGRQINQMSGQIDSLMKSRIQDEKEKKDLEIKMLQAQINPHFLYNTLDSIKWIATVQKNTGIVQVVTALSSLLKNMAKGFNEKVTLRQELDFLENYIVIEKIRYIELFDVETQVDDDALYQAKIIKLTLQPIVENSIFSGIEPSGRFGLIRIHAWQEETSLCVSVEDNGIGIEPENIDKLLTDTSKITKSTMSGIGLPNVDRRLKLVYGEEYGLSIESEPGQYTRVTIRLPLEV